MSTSRVVEERALDKAELDLVSQSHHPELQALSDKEVATLLGRLRERRDKAQGEVKRRRREMRGKAAAKGATPATSADGNKAKLEFLSSAVARLNAERSRRQRMGSKITQADLSRRAFGLKQTGDESEDAPENTRHAHDGLRKIVSERRENLVRPMERGRLRKAQAVTQARKDAR